MATATQEGKQAKPLPPPNSDFYELAETLGAEEHALLKQLRTGVFPVCPRHSVPGET